jgi:hypothetical protein
MFSLVLETNGLRGGKDLFHPSAAGRGERGIHQVIDACPDQRLHRVTEAPSSRRVGSQDASISVDKEDGPGSCLQNGARQLLILAQPVELGFQSDTSMGSGLEIHVAHFNLPDPSRLSAGSTVAAARIVWGSCRAIVACRSSRRLQIAKAFQQRQRPGDRFGLQAVVEAEEATHLLRGRGRASKGRGASPELK